MRFSVSLTNTSNETLTKADEGNECNVDPGGPVETFFPDVLIPHSTDRNTVFYLNDGSAKSIDCHYAYKTEVRAPRRAGCCRGRDAVAVR